MRLLIPVLTLASLVLAAYAPAPSAPAADGVVADSTQWENLQVLPDSISGEALTQMMRGFGTALGVKCGHCHVRGEGGMDFASDAKPHKQIAREMIRMVVEINGETLPGIERETGHDHGEHSGSPDGHRGTEAHDASRARETTARAEHASLRVTCWTCHRGELVPATAPPSE